MAGGPAGGFGILDHDRRAKPAWRAVEAACAPVIAVADPFPIGLADGCNRRLKKSLKLSYAATGRANSAGSRS